jgi:hypothetical protein
MGVGFALMLRDDGQLRVACACSLHRWVDWFLKEHYDVWVRPPQTLMELNTMETIFSRCGLPGCVASMDGVHVELGCAPARDRHLYVGKEGYPTVAFNVCVGHNLHIYSCSQAHYGARNDKTMATLDGYLKMVRMSFHCIVVHYI